MQIYFKEVFMKHKELLGNYKKIQNFDRLLKDAKYSYYHKGKEIIEYFRKTIEKIIKKIKKILK